MREIIRRTAEEHVNLVDEHPNVLRFFGAAIGADDIRRIHGIDERIGVGAYADAVRIYLQLLRNAAL